jgi:hypothetical protein
MFSREKDLMALVRWDGMATFHNGHGWEVQAPLNIMTQEGTMRLLGEQGFEEVHGL